MTVEKGILATHDQIALGTFRADRSMVSAEDFHNIPHLFLHYRLQTVKEPRGYLAVSGLMMVET